MSRYSTHEPSAEQLHSRFPGVRFWPVPEFPFYLIGDNGSVWHCRTRGGLILKEWRQMTPTIIQGGYSQIGLRRGKKLHSFDVNILVLIVFVGPRPEGLWGLHNDGDPTNNHVGNLRWGTPTDNAADRIKHGRNAQGERNGEAKVTEDQVREIRRRCAAGEYQYVVGPDYGLSQTQVSRIVRRAIWKCVE